MDILETGLQGFCVGVAVAALILLALDLHLTTDRHRDARRRNRQGDRW